MKNYSITLRFDHRRRTDKGKEGPVEVRIIYKRKSYYINTGVRVREDEFTGMVTGNRPERDAMNERLVYILRRVNDVMVEMSKGGEAFDVEMVKSRVFKEEKAQVDLMKWFEDEIPKLKIKTGTRKHYDTLLKRMAEFGGFKKWSDLNAKKLYEWDIWLHGLSSRESNGDRQAGNEVKGISDGSVYTYHKNLKALLTRAVKLGVLDVNPYDRMKGEFKRADRAKVEYLTEDELAAVESLKPVKGTRMAMARDLFVFQLYTGLSYSDTQAFDINDYKKVDGRWVAVNERLKTGVPYVSKLLQQAVDVLKKYNMQTPKINNTHYNLCLKTIQQACGIKTNLHSHLARHTFATRMLAMGAKIENVSKMLGHTNITQTQRYAQVLAKSVMNDFDMFESKTKTN